MIGNSMVGEGGRFRKPSIVILLIAGGMLGSGCTSGQAKRWSMGSNPSCTVTYLGGDSQQRLVCPNSFRTQSLDSDLSVWRRTNQETLFTLEELDREDALLCYKLAEIARGVVRDEVGIARPSLRVLLFPTAHLGSVQIKVPVNPQPGLSVGVPVRNGEIIPREATMLLLLMVHESTESFFVFRDLRNGPSLYSDTRNRWIGEGMANLMAAMAIDQAAAQGLAVGAFPFPKCLLTNANQRSNAISVKGWLPGQSGHGRYEAAEYLCYLWFQAARQRGHAAPVAEFVEWLTNCSGDAGHDEVLDWLGRTSGIDMKDRSKSLPMEEVRQYYRDRWLSRKWSLPEGL